MSVHQRIEVRPDVIIGRPAIRGSRVAVELVLRKPAENITIADLLDGDPRMTRADVRAAFQCAADTLAREEVVVRPTGTEGVGDRPVRFLADGSCDFAVVRAPRAAKGLSSE